MKRKAERAAIAAQSALASADTIVIPVESDQHAGSRVAVCPPVVRLDDGGEYHASRAQKWLWGRRLAFWERAARVRDQHKAALAILFNGDWVDGNHHGTTQIIEGSSAAQSQVVSACLEAPLALEPDALWFIRGTEAHVGKSAATEEAIAEGLRRDGRPVIGDEDTGTASHWHAKMEFQGVRIDAAHHGRVGQRPWTKQNITNLLAFQIWTEHHIRGEPHPHIAIRSHLHQYVDTGNAHQTRVLQTPAYQLHTAFTHKVVTESMADIGGIIIVIRDGAYTVEPVIFRPESPKVWRPS